MKSDLRADGRRSRMFLTRASHGRRVDRAGACTRYGIAENSAEVRHVDHGPPRTGAGACRRGSGDACSFREAWFGVVHEGRDPACALAVASRDRWGDPMPGLRRFPSVIASADSCTTGDGYNSPHLTGGIQTGQMAKIQSDPWGVHNN